MNDELPLTPFPNWASWASRDVFRPPSFHTKPGFAVDKNRLHTPPTNVAQQVCMVLGIGLGIRDIMRSVEIELADDSAQAPPWLTHSQLKVQDADALLENAPALENLVKRWGLQLG